MKTAAVFMDTWKLPIFSRRLREAGFSYDTGAGPTPSMLVLKVRYEMLADLQPVLEAAQKECASHRQEGV